MQSDWKDRKGRHPIHGLFDGMCLDTFLTVGGIEFIVFVLFWCSFSGCFIPGSRGGESQLKNFASSCPACPARGFERVCLLPGACYAQAHVLVAPFPRASFRLVCGEPSSPSSSRFWRWNSLRVAKASTAAAAVLQKGNR